MAYLRHSIFAASVLVAATATSAIAGGGFGYPAQPVVPVPAPIPIPDYANSFYLRGDLGWVLYETPEIGAPGINYSSDKMEDSWTLGVGIGYNFHDNFRGDITLDYHNDAEVSAIDPATSAKHESDLSSTIVLANVYYDIRERDGFTPYVGAGIGFTYNKMDRRSIVAGGVTTTSGGDGTTAFAAALMAGFSYRMNSGWMVDAGYRYLFLGDATTESSATTGSLRVDDIQAQEFRLGFRYEFQ